LAGSKVLNAQAVATAEIHGAGAAISQVIDQSGALGYS
jgi:hypothetical protein